jgi:hypothetical protein
MTIFGPKTTAWFDVWSFEHFVSGMAISTICVLLADKLFLRGLCEIPRAVETRVYVVTILLVEYAWEVAEFYLEAGYSGVPAITHWFHGVEFWGNRVLSDPLVTLSGGLIALRHSAVVLPARVFSLGFLIIHLFVFPHCMHLHEVLGL